MARFIFLITISVCLLALADRLTLTDGSVINGTVKSIAAGKATVETEFAGTITIDQQKILRLSTAGAVNIARPDGQHTHGVLTAEPRPAEASSPALPPEQIKFLWRDGAEDPTLPPPRKWDGEIGLSLNGKTGNTEKFNGGIGIKANYAGPLDALHLYGGGNYERENHVTGTRKYLAGIDFERKIAGTDNTWYTKLEFERQPTNGLRMRSEAGAGYGYYIVSLERTKLRVRGGLTGKTRSYTDDTHDDAVGTELGIHFEHMIQKWGKWVTDLTWQPNFDSIHDYRALHVSSLDIPLLFEFPLSLRLGVSNEYNSRIANDATHMETTYFAKMVFKWK